VAYVGRLTNNNKVNNKERQIDAYRYVIRRLRQFRVREEISMKNEPFICDLLVEYNRQHCLREWFLSDMYPDFYALESKTPYHPENGFGWWPQNSAGIKERIRVLRTLIGDLRRSLEENKS
jgi:hypothetical protein